MKNKTSINNTVNKSTAFNHWYLPLAPNTILTVEIISIFTQYFYDQVLSLTNSTTMFFVSVKFADGRSYHLTPTQWINKDVALSVLVEIIYCFWANRTAFLDGSPPSEATSAYPERVS